MDRREFLKLLLAGLLVREVKPCPDGDSKKWNILDHFHEFLESTEYSFPYPEEFLYAERVMFLKRSLPFRPQYEGTKYLRIDFATHEHVDVKLYLSDRIRTLYRRPPKVFKNVKGNFYTLIPLEDMGKEIYYQVLYRKNKKFKPLSPVRMVRNIFAPRRKIIVYLFADGHVFDDRFNKAIPIKSNNPLKDEFTGVYFFDFLRKSFDNPQWILEENDPNAMQFHLRNTFHLAEGFATLIRMGDLPEAIIKMGDDIGLDHYRLKRQGLLKHQWDRDARLLWRRERKIWSILTPLVPVYQVIGNHDGEDGWKIFRKATIKHRKMMFYQPGIWEFNSSDQDFYSVEFGDWLQFLVLDVVGYTKKLPVHPGKWTLGNGQMRWLEDRLKSSNYRVKFIFLHHVLGGFPSGSGGEPGRAYGRGPLFTEEDYLRHDLEPESIEQPKITNLAIKNGVKGFFYGHDHVHFVKNYGKFFAMAVGTTNEVAEEKAWEKIEGWEEEYGRSEDLSFLNSPIIEKLEITPENILIKTFCASVLDKDSNLQILQPAIGEEVWRTLIEYDKG